MALGVFDSGVGGLTVYKELMKAFPRTNLFYLGDTARLPYGNKSPETIVRYALECGNYLVDKYSVSGLIVACNTMSSYAIKDLEQAFGIPVLGVIEAGTKQALQTTKNSKIGVIGTKATINSNEYMKMLEFLSPDCVEVFQKACPLFVPLVEEGFTSGEICKLTIKFYLDEIISKNIDTLILGCTHYPVLKDVISMLYPAVSLVDSSAQLIKQISAADIAQTEGGLRELLITDNSPSFGYLKDSLVGNIKTKIVNISCD